MTPLSKAQQILNGVEATAAGMSVAMPRLRYAQLATQVVSVESVIVAATSMEPDAAYGPLECNASQLATFVVSWALDCSWVSNDDGTDDPTRVAEASARMDTVAEVLWEFASGLDAFLSKQWSIGWAFIGGLGIVTLQLTTGVD